MEQKQNVMQTNKTIFGLLLFLAISIMSCSKETIVTNAEALKQTNMVNGAYTVVDEQPMPTGGMEQFYKYVGETLKYPEQAKKDSIQGKVFVKFMVDKNGKLSRFKILKGIGHGCDEAVLEVLKSSPAWIPGEHNGRIVKVWMTLPIIFRL